MAMVDDFLKKLDDKQAVIGIVGLGYVGLPLALSFCEKGFKVFGLDVSQNTVKATNEGKSLIKHIDSKRVEKAVKEGLLEATTDFTRSGEPDTLLICVPTPLTKHREPDVSYIVDTAKAIGPYLKKGQLVALESTTYPGTTRELLVPMLQEKSNLIAGKDFWVAYSPEREDPNNPNFETSTIPKVVGGFTSDCQKVAVALYDQIIVQTVPVSNAATAEATKLLENIFRSVNIALVNELKVLFHRMDIDMWEVVDAAKTKPFGFMPFYPGPGLGGHCIPIDPFYLTWKAREYGLSTRFIELAGEINTQMPDYVVQRTMEALNENGKALKNAKVLLVGLAYKPNVDDDRESPTYALWQKLENKGAKVDYFDTYIPVVRETREHPQFAGVVSKTIDDVPNYDVVLISTDHKNINYDFILDKAQLIVDTRHVMPNHPKVFRG